MHSRLVPPLALLCLLAAAPASPALQPRSAFLLMSGRDTLALESVSRSEGRLAGTLVFRPLAQRVDYVLALAPDLSVARLELEIRGAADGPAAKPKRTVTMRFAGDSAFVDAHDGAPKRFGGQRGVMPFVNPSMAMVELLARAHRPSVGGRDSAVLFGGGTPLRVSITRPTRDTVVVAMGGVSFLLGTDADGYVTGGSVPEQRLEVVATGPLSDSLLLTPKPDYSAPPDAPYTARNVVVESRAGHRLAGTLTVPRGAKRPVPCVVTITGSGPEERDEALPIVPGYRPFRQIADVLGRHGIAVLRCDDRGTGESGGNFAAATSADFAKDTEDELAWLRTQPEIDGARLGLLGHSEGGMIGPMVAAEDSKLRALVVMAGPSYTGRRIFAYQQGYSFDRLGLTGAARDSAAREAASQLDSSAVTSVWMRFFLDYDPLPTARRVSTPTLVLQGAKDWQVTPVQASELAAAIRSGGDRDVTLRVFPDTDHLFLHDPSGDPAGYAGLAENSIRPEVMDALTSWLERELK